MGDINQVLFIRRHAAALAGPYLEVGSRDYGSTQDLQALVAADQPYLRVDMEPGAKVDLALDLTLPFEELDRRLQGRRFGTIFCLSVLEHCQQPFAMAENLTRLLQPAGQVCLSVPFAYRFHGYPSDFWRFTHEGVKLLFPRLAFLPEHSAWASTQVGDLRPIDRWVGAIGFGSKFHRRQGRPVRGAVAKGLRLLAKLGILRWLCDYEYVLAPSNIFMIGTLAR